MHSGKRVFTGFVTLLLLAGAFFLYTETIGRFTDFPQVTQEDLTPIHDNSPDDDGTEMIREADFAAIRAFGPYCPELNADLVSENRQRNADESERGRGLGTFVYIKKYTHLKDRRFLHLKPFSLVYIHKTGEGRPETDAIETLRGNEAIIEFDRVIDITKLSSKSTDGEDQRPKAVGFWIKGDVTLKTNRRTADNAADDIVVFTDEMRYSADRNLIWADDWIRMTSSDMRVEGIGMELGLYPESQEKLKRKPNSGAVETEQDLAADEASSNRKSDIKYLRLVENVRFHLQLDNSDDLFGKDGSKEGEDAKPVDPTQEKVPVTVTSLGPFYFDAEANQGTFEKFVQMLRKNPPKAPGDPEMIDSIDCNKLVLQFKDDDTAKKDPAAPKKEQNLALANATATGGEVILISASQKLEATGNYLFYDAESRKAVLKGEKEMIAYHNNTVIHGRSLVMEQDDRKERKLIVDGPDAWLEMLGEETDAGKGPSELHIRWQDRLETNGKGDGEMQLVTITGDVELEYHETASRSDRLDVWLKSVKSDNVVTQTAGSSDTKQDAKGRWEPVKIDAHGHVSFDSKEMALVADDVRIDIVPSVTKPAEAKQPEQPLEPTAAIEVVETPGNGPQPQLQPQPVAQDEKPAESKRQMSVKAKRVVALVERNGSEMKPSKVWADGGVIVIQPPKNPADESVEITGDTLDYVLKPNGEEVHVTGGSQLPAIIKTDKMELAGYAIHMDEFQNRVEVTRAGFLILYTENDLTGKTATAPLPLRVDWTQDMYFDGREAEFRGDVIAHQGNQKVRCQRMVVTLANKIFFREVRESKGPKGKESSQIEMVVCDKDVLVTEMERQGNFAFTKYQLESAELRIYNLDQRVLAAGPGRVAIIERNEPRLDDKGNTVPPDAPFNKTIVNFNGAMRADQLKRTADFFEDVHIVHSPIDSPDFEIDELNLPENGIVIDAADDANMRESKLASGEVAKEFIANGDVRIKAREYFANGDKLSYDQKKDLLVLYGSEGNKASFFKREKPGQEPTQGDGSRLSYNTKTKELQVQGSTGVNGFNISD